MGATTMHRPASAWVAATGALVLSVLASVALAVTCGDADGNGTVSVTDGVQVLRAAAELSSSCSASLCDVDGNGSVTVTDGVIVLRQVAGLAVDLKCPPAVSGALSESARQALDNNPHRIFGPITKVSGSSSAVRAHTPRGEVLPDGPIVGSAVSQALAGQSVACDQGNQTLERCEVVSGIGGGIASVSTIRFNACTTVTTTGFIRQDGVVRVTIPGSSDCIFYTRSQLPFGKEIFEERLDFVSRFFDQRGNVFRQDTEQISQQETFLDLCRGSAGEQFASNSRRALDGTLEILIPGDGGTVRFQQTHIDVSFTRLFSADCATRTTTLEGGTVQVEDGRFNERYVADYDDLSYVLRAAGSGGSTLNLDGTLTSTGCGGSRTVFRYRTLTAPAFDASDPDACPRGGAVEIARGATVIGQIVFTTGGGVRIEGAGGQAIEYASCNDPALIMTCGR